jgi:hypothetical protein
MTESTIGPPGQTPEGTLRAALNRFVEHPPELGRRALALADLISNTTTVQFIDEGEKLPTLPASNLRWGEETSALFLQALGTVHKDAIETSAAWVTRTRELVDRVAENGLASVGIQRLVDRDTRQIAARRELLEGHNLQAMWKLSLVASAARSRIRALPDSVPVARALDSLGSELQKLANAIDAAALVLPPRGRTRK